MFKLDFGFNFLSATFCHCIFTFSLNKEFSVLFNSIICDIAQLCLTFDPVRGNMTQPVIFSILKSLFSGIMIIIIIIIKYFRGTSEMLPSFPCH